ncbi:MAG: HutD family protein [Pseudomonadota bacterium]
MKLIRIDDIAPAPWKNGGGVTRELALCADDKGFAWRLSVAEVARAGPFSAFPGLKRVLTVIEGAGLILRHAGGAISALPGAPVRFDGDMAIDCDLANGKVRDFNLIYDPARQPMDVIRLGAGAHDARGIGLLPLGGDCFIDGSGAVPAGSFALFESAIPMRVTVTVAALLVTLD